MDEKIEVYGLRKINCVFDRRLSVGIYICKNEDEPIVMTNCAITQIYTNPVRRMFFSLTISEGRKESKSALCFSSLWLHLHLQMRSVKNDCTIKQIRAVNKTIRIRDLN